jgi:hypothetical protein
VISKSSTKLTTFLFDVKTDEESSFELLFFEYLLPVEVAQEINNIEKKQ